MHTNKKKELVLIAEDNPDEALLLRRAIEKAGIRAPIKMVRDGEEVLLYLQGLGAFANRRENPLPTLIILDLKMPRKSGFEVLEWLNHHPQYDVVPTVVMSTSGLDKDVRKAYGLGANTFFVKPTDFNDLVSIMTTVRDYWERALRA